MMVAGWTLLGFAVMVVLYTYALYPLLLKLFATVPGPLEGPSGPDGGEERADGLSDNGAEPGDWPAISITVPVYNEVRQIRETVESLLRIDYPADRRHLLFVSDASDDGTDEIIREYEDRGVELLRMKERGGKTAAENGARTHVTGEIVVSTDASVRLRPDAVKELVRQFRDPTVGVATGRDVSTGQDEGDGNVGESGYVGYEMWVRDLETRAGGIVGASGSLYAIRRDLHQYELPEGLSRDFASALVARERGYRAVSVPAAACVVPRTGSLRKEYRRKVRTMIRGLQTLFFKRHLLNPARYGRFAWMLFSHKVCRWAVPWALALGGAGVVILSVYVPAARLVLAAGLLTLLVGGFGWLWPDGRPMPRILAVPAFAIGANVAAMVAAVRSLRGELNPTWEPTRREPTATGGAGLEMNSGRIYH